MDYDGDGDTDIIDSNSGVHLYLNNGAGQFTAPLLIANEPGGLRAADFDNDGDIDLFFGSSGTSKILENQGSNSFTIAVQKQIPINGSFYVQLNDYDLDGFLDVWFGGEKLYYCKSTGPFSFADAINVQQFSYSSDNLYDLGDLDADGLPDLYFGETNGRWRKNLGNGTFSPDIPLCTNIIHKGIADLDHDGYLDAYGYLKENDINQFGYAKNNGDQAYKWIPIADSLLNPKAVDMNADGLLDIVAGIGRNQIGSFYPKRIEVWLNEGPANFPTKLVLPNKPANWLATLETFTADADGDGDTDIFAYISKSDAITKRNIALMLNDGNGQLTFHAYLSSSDILYLWGAHVHDFDGDGDPDVIFSYTNEVRWMENLGNNNFTPIKMALDLGDLDFGTFYSLADFDNDGVVDIIGGPTTSLNIAYWRSLAGVIDGPHELDAEIEYPYNLTVVDFDLDGDNDIMYAVLDEGLYGDDYYYMYLAENLGNENFAPTDYIDVKYPSGSYYAQEDIDGDGDKDIILFTTGIGDQSQLRWFPNLAEDHFTLRGRTFWDMNGNGTFDVGDYPFTNRKAKLFPQGQLIYANIEGKFLIQGSTGTNHLTTEPDTIWQLTTTPDTFQIDLPKPPNSASEYIFGFEALTDTLLGEAFLQTSSLRCNTTTSQWGGVLNNGTTLMSGTVAYTPDANATLHSFDPLPSSVANGTYFFDFENIPPGSYFVFKMALTMPDVSFWILRSCSRCKHTWTIRLAYRLTPSTIKSLVRCCVHSTLTTNSLSQPGLAPTASLMQPQTYSLTPSVFKIQATTWPSRSRSRMNCTLCSIGTVCDHWQQATLTMSALMLRDLWR
ncbi:MAG: VCBS repeat-containing protein [Saprospiraceae bacterium]|nr:VCBS repeat-containing protein [Saprospiraceae bacterium]